MGQRGIRGGDEAATAAATAAESARARVWSESEVRPGTTEWPLHPGVLGQPSPASYAG